MGRWAAATVSLAVVLSGCSLAIGSQQGDGPTGSSAPSTGATRAGRAPVAARSALPKVFPTSGPAITPAVRAARTGIVKITGIAAACSRVQEGSGFVVAPGQVLTNAHVVQGVRTEHVQVGGTGKRYSASVVLYRPDIDLAVLRVRALTAKALVMTRQDLPDGAVVAAAGFPLDRGFHLDGGSVSDLSSTAGPQVGGTRPLARPVYTLKITIEPGNSGGPLLAPDGTVVGVVFAKEQGSAKAGFAITSAQAQQVASAAAGRTTRVSSGRCS